MNPQFSLSACNVWSMWNNKAELHGISIQSILEGTSQFNMHLCHRSTHPSDHFLSPHSITTLFIGSSFVFTKITPYKLPEHKSLPQSLLPRDNDLIHQIILSTYHVPSMGLDTGYKLVNKTKKVLALRGLQSSGVCVCMHVCIQDSREVHIEERIFLLRGPNRKKELVVSRKWYSKEV